MKLSPYQKAIGIVLLVGIFAFVSAFITHSDQPATYGGIGVIVAFSISIIIVGLVQVGSSYARGKPIVWYKQYELTLGLSFLCISLVIVIVGIFQFLLPDDPSLLHYYLEVATLLLCPLLGFSFCFCLSNIGPINRDRLYLAFPSLSNDTNTLREMDKCNCCISVFLCALLVLAMIFVTDYRSKVVSFQRVVISQ